MIVCKMRSTKWWCQQPVVELRYIKSLRIDNQKSLVETIVEGLSYMISSFMTLSHFLCTYVNITRVCVAYRSYIYIYIYMYVHICKPPILILK